VLASALSTRDFRNLAGDRIELGAGVTIVHGANGAGKTNLLEALFFALTGRSCRTRREREMIGFGADLARTEAWLSPVADEGLEPMRMLASVSRAEGRSRRVDGREPTAEDDRRRPAVSVFMPDRLALVKGAPASRRAHLDRLVAALWPARAGYRAAYDRALAQRNALLSRLRGGGDMSALGAWDRELATAALPLVEARAAASAALEEPFTRTAEVLGLDGESRLAYRPRTGEGDATEIERELAERRSSDLARGFTTWGPHRDDVELSREGHSVRNYGSQGQQRLALLALLFAEREALRSARRTLPLMLLDDVMSELDPDRRARLVTLLGNGGQALITATEREQVPGSAERALEIAAGAVVEGG
jgi:DNA replication and repair protein RecF